MGDKDGREVGEVTKLLNELRQANRVPSGSCILLDKP